MRSIYLRKEPLLMKDKILEVSCSGLENGGVQHVIMNIVSALHEDYTFDALVFTNGPDYFDGDFCAFGGQIFRIPNKQFPFRRNLDSYIRGPRIFFGTLKILREHGPYSAIHCHNYFESAFCLLAAKAAGVKARIAHSHNDASNVTFSKPRAIKQRLLQPIVNQCATIRIGCSRNASDYLFGKDMPATTVLNGIDLRPFASGRQNSGYKAGKQIRLLHVGNFNVQKNQLFLVDLMGELRKRNLNFRLTMVGGGDESYRNLVVRRIQEEGLQDWITILPHDSDIPEQMRRADLFLFPSLFEGLGIVLIEAQASGLHSLVSGNVPPEADLGNIRYLASLDVPLWADAVQEIIQRGQPRVFVDMEKYDIQNVAEDYRRIYQSC